MKFPILQKISFSLGKTIGIVVAIAIAKLITISLISLSKRFAKTCLSSFILYLISFKVKVKVTYMSFIIFFLNESSSKKFREI